MADTVRNLPALLALFADGQAPGSISPQDARDMIVSLFANFESVGTPAISGGTLTLDLSVNQNFRVAFNANVTTFNLINMVAGAYASGITLELTADGTPRTFVEPGSIVPLNGVYTPSSTNGKRDMLAYWTNDGGTTWRRMIVAQNY